MSQLLILGNGFDLQCSLKSSYKDFFEHCIIDNIAIGFNIQQMKIAPNQPFGFWEKLLFEYFQIFGNVNYTWCDIEEIIRLALLDIKIAQFDNESLSIQISSIKYPNGENLPESIVQENKISTFIERCYDKYIQDNCKQDYYDDSFPHLFLATVSKKYYLFLLQELKNFERRFCKYIKEIIVNPSSEKELNDKYIVNAANLIANLTDFTEENFENLEDVIEQKDEQYWIQTTSSMRSSAWRKINVLNEEFSKLKGIYILSFNYTALFDIVAVEDPCLYSNVHGKLCLENCDEKCTSSTIIFGIDDTVIQSQKLNDELRLFSKTYRKMFDTSAPTSILPPNNGKPLTIKFYGHSLSEADYSYFQSIFDYYNLYNNSNIDLIFFYSKGFEQTDAIYRLINTYGTTLINQQQGKNLMHKLLLENRLKIIETSLNT